MRDPLPCYGTLALANPLERALNGHGLSAATEDGLAPLAEAPGQPSPTPGTPPSPTPPTPAPQPTTPPPPAPPPPAP